jgi:hypothetical protein
VVPTHPVSSLQNQGKQALRAQQVETPDTCQDPCPEWLAPLVASAGTILPVSNLQNQGKQALRAQLAETPDTILDLCPEWPVLLAQQARVELQAVLGEPSHQVFRLLGRVLAAHLA